METKQNAIELLKEAMDASVRVLDGLNARIDRASKQGEPIPVYDGIVELHDLIGKIYAYLSAPSDSATGEKWGPSTIDKIRQRNADGDFTLDYWRATELIEDYGRRVPREFVEEILDEAWNCLTDRLGGNVLQKIAAKYGVKMEG